MEFKTSKDIFTCQQCGDCCQGFGGTYVSNEDIKKIADFLKIDEKAFIKKYCVPSGSRYVLNQGSDEKCIFFDGLCSIHHVKPYMCRAWPFIETVVNHPENWNAMANSCPGMVKNVPAKKIKEIVAKEIEKLS